MAITPRPAPASKQASSSPTRKVLAGGVAGAITLVVVWALNTYFLPLGKPITGEIAAALTTLASFGLSYWVDPSAADQVVKG